MRLAAQATWLQPRRLAGPVHKNGVILYTAEAFLPIGAQKRGVFAYGRGIFVDSCAKRGVFAYDWTANAIWCAKRAVFAYDRAASVDWCAKQVVFAYDRAVSANWCAKQPVFAYGLVAHDEDLPLAGEEGGEVNQPGPGDDLLSNHTPKLMHPEEISKSPGRKSVQRASATS